MPETVAAPAAPDFDALAVGDVVAEREFHLTRDSLVRYAGASGDFNPIHYRDDVAASVGLPGVLAHGMLTMGLAVQPVVDWAGDPARVLDYQVRFTRPVVVDPEAGADVSVSAKVGQLDAEARAVRVDLTVAFEGATVLGKAQVRVVLA
ncbi:MaoC family dehydratase [Agromyces sp. M3QZ16-3]|uniref:MaoC family dehydratase n=1 Tax=Agromyces sp. M3QZ16-3 TaxID=3447585 RepID=UPI003F69103B